MFRDGRHRFYRSIEIYALRMFRCMKRVSTQTSQFPHDLLRIKSLAINFLHEFRKFPVRERANRFNWVGIRLRRPFSLYLCPRVHHGFFQRQEFDQASETSRLTGRENVLATGDHTRA